MREIIKTLVNDGLSRLGYRVVRATPERPNPLSLREALRRTSARVPDVGSVIDVGASDGQWTRVAREFFPTSRYFLIEANPVHEPALRSYTAATPGVDYLLAAAGDTRGELYFDASDAFGGVAAHEHRAGMVKLPATTIDHEVATRNLPPPYLIKLDTHGFEVPIFAGAMSTLERTALLVVEAYNFRIAQDSLRFFELCAYLEQRGFLPSDLCEPMHRQRDGLLWQFDLVFMRANRQELAYNRYE
jgi:FkbM family methyltransferase